MISGRFGTVTATVEQRVRGARDALGNEVVAYASPTEVDVLVQTGITADMAASRPEGVTVAATVHFPKGWRGDLRGARVTLPAPWDWGNPYHVVGVPMPYDQQNCPPMVPFNMAVEVEATDG